MTQLFKTMRQMVHRQPVSLLIVGVLLAGIAHGLIEILAMAQAHWRQPTLFGDSFSFVFRGEGGPIAQWIFHHHNEHRIVWAKATSILETELLQLPPGQSALFQNLALILGCAGLWSWLCNRLLRRPDLQLLTALAGWLLLLNPWQYENLSWEFQTPWFLINALVMGGALLLSVRRPGIACTVLALLMPWIALASSGQGLAAALAFAACTWLHSHRLGLLVSGSSLIAAITCFMLLPYSKPANHPELNFQLDYFLRAWLGGPWQGLAMLCLVITTVLLARRQPIPKISWPPLLMPGLFSLLFAGMITLSRSGFGLDQANASRYISHSMMLGLSALLTLALVEDRSRLQAVPLLGAFLVLITTVGSFPQQLQAGKLTYSGAWAKGDRWAEEKRERFVCHAQQAALKAQGITPLEPCKEIHPRQHMVDSYFQGASPVKPMGWHSKLLGRPSTNSTTSVNGAAIHYALDEQTLNNKTVQLRGWAFLKANPQSRLYLLINYDNDLQLGGTVNLPRTDVREAYMLPNERVGFEAAAPLTLDGQRLHFISISGTDATIKIWEEVRADG